MSNGQLKVAYNPSSGGSVALAKFALPMHVTSLSFKSTAIYCVDGDGGAHTNAYLQTNWADSWAPQQGSGSIFNANGGRMFVFDATLSPYYAPLLVANQQYQQQITISGTNILWDLSTCTGTVCGGTGNTVYDTISYGPVAMYSGKDRYLYLGGWDTTNLFTEITIEGEF